MVLTPAELEHRVRQKLAPVAARVEEDIDAALEERFDGNCVSIAVPQCADRRVIEQVLAKYRSAGWNVKHQSDQRDGDYLEFRKDSGAYWDR